MIFRTAIILAATLVLSLAAIADEQKWRSGDALIGEPKYGADFKHYDHVNPDAPKGGQLNSAVPGGFDSFNPFVTRGRPAAGLTYFGGVLYDGLATQSLDQPSASYGLVSESYRRADDYSWAEYRINPKARWHDGKPITAEDVIWSFENLRKVDPRWSSYFKNLAKTEIVGERTVRFEFDIKGNRELPHIIGDLPILPRHWWEGTDDEGNKRDISQPTTEPPLGSGPYRIAEFELGKSIIWERVEDYWGVDHPTRVGRFNFDRLKYTYFLDQTALWESFKKGGVEDIRLENQSRRWATEYTFPAFERGDVVKKIFPETGPQIFQAFYFNTRLEKFSDIRVRQAIGLMFDFETMNKNLFYDSYTRTDSPFEGGELESSGVPMGRELEILERYRNLLPDQLFTEPFELPTLGSNSSLRKAQRKAIKLFKAAGYTFSGGKMIGPDGNQFTIEFLDHSQTGERIVNPFIENLRKIGVEATLRVVDTAQYQNRSSEFEFEMTSSLSIHSVSLGNEQRDYWTSKAAETTGSRNLAGIKEPIIDELVDQLISAPDRKELIHLAHALDRVLKWKFYTVPMWHLPERRVAHWKHIQIPETQPGYIGVDFRSAWFDTGQN